MNYNNLITLIYGLSILYILFSKKEKMSNTDMKAAINEIYQADINSIRNLSKLANNLINDRKLVVPGGLKIEGTLEVKDNVTMQKGLEVKDKVTIQNELEVKDKVTMQRGLEVKENVTMQKRLEVKDKVTMQKELKVKDKVTIHKGLTIIGAIYSNDLTTKLKRI